MKQINRSTTSAILLTTALLGFSWPAMARMILSVDDPSTTGVDIIVIDDVDGGVGDGTPKGFATHADGTPGDGFVSFVGILGGFMITVANGAATTAESATLMLTASAMSSGAGTLNFMLTDSDFVWGQPGTQIHVTSALNGSTMSSFGQPENTFSGEQFIDFGSIEFGMDNSIAGPQGPMSIGVNVGGSAFPGGGAFALTEQLTFTFASAGMASANITSTATAPEPATLALLGLGLAGLGCVRRKG